MSDNIVTLPGPNRGKRSPVASGALEDAPKYDWQSREAVKAEIERHKAVRGRYRAGFEQPFHGAFKVGFPDAVLFGLRLLAE